MPDPSMTLPLRSVQRIYDLIGKRYDWFSLYDAHAKERAIQWLGLQPGMAVLDAGVGSGKEHQQIQKLILPGGYALGLDISMGMLAAAKKRCNSPFYQADVRRLPFAPGFLDRIYAAYLLDIQSQDDILVTLKEFYRVLKPGGCLVVLSLTEGINAASRALVSVWKTAYSLSPIICAGCRPLQLSVSLGDAGFTPIQHEVIVQCSVPSEIILAGKMRF